MINKNDSMSISDSELHIKLDELIDKAIFAKSSQNVDTHEDLPIVIQGLEALLPKINPDDKNAYFVKAFISFANDKYNDYLIFIDTYIEKYIAEVGLIDYETAQVNFMNIFYNMYNDDAVLTFKSFLKKFHMLLRKHCADSAFEYYVKSLLSVTSNNNIKVKYLNEVLDKDDTWAVAYTELGNIYFDSKEWLLATQNYEKAMISSDLQKTDGSYSFMAYAYSKLKEFSKEEDALRKCLAITPSYPYGNNNLGYCLYRQKKYQESILFFDKSIELGIDKYYPYRNKFEALLKLENIQEAVELVKIAPEYFNTKYYKDKISKIVGGTRDMADIFEKLQETTESNYAGEMQVEDSKSGIILYAHQQDAIRAMNSKILNSDDYAGLLVLPTGGGKTLTATYWLMNSLLDKGKKIVWLAHRHELLNQAQQSFERVCYSDIAKNKPSYNWRIISGQHDKPVHIKPTDDIIIASKTSLKRGLNYFLNNWLKANADEVFLIIDEAHHATASEYRDLIEVIKANTKKFQMLGLTATPFRTADNEQGLLKKVFPNDIAYKIDLRELINRGILSDPIFKSVSTDVNMLELFQENDADGALERIINENFFDIGNIGSDTAYAIATNSKRNNAIVHEYIKNKSKYKKTLVFALTVDMAIALNALFKAAGVKSDFVVSSIKDMVTGITTSPEENAEKIQAFRDGDLDVLVNVNILTEGTDLPDVQSVFLTRPTKSTILMTQMIGRALRGEKAGGTKEAYIVSFVDDWQNRIAWVNPEQLFIGEDGFGDVKDHKTQKMAMRLVAISKIEEFAKIANDTIDSGLSEIAFIDRIPVGIYKFTYLFETKDDDEFDKSCDILVYDCMKPAFEELFEWLPTADLSNADIAANHIDTTLFGVQDLLLGYDKQDIVDIIKYYGQTQAIPQWIPLSEREDYDPSVLAQHIVNSKLDPLARDAYISNEWSKSDSHWSAFFGIDNQRAFRKLVDDAIDRILHPEEYEEPKAKPITEKEKIQIQDLPLHEMRERYPELEEKLRDTIFEKFTDADGYYYSAKSGYKSKRKLDFQIDHILAMAKGGKSTLDNLQLLTVAENMSKSDK
ncbi:MAG: DEAD/DEAH box helicase family protein [Clostridiales Family XIII bacterium]|jgi:superfamily II DNA or RNA helicase/tetratricopeptide (TPR) repeat protein|nr:DEAD/DEAH box helicase family protein [Clostridiales Family XIII bacterium]